MTTDRRVSLDAGGMRIVASDALPPGSAMLVNEDAVADFLTRRFRGDPPPSPDDMKRELATAVAVDPETYAVLMRGLE